MMNHIEKQRLQETGSLDAVSFFHFLVKEGCRLSLINSEELEALQHQLVKLLAAQFNRHTGGFSSSVPVETGQRIQQSVFYIVGYYLKSFPDMECALNALKDNPLEDLFLKGKTRVEDTRKKADRLLRTVQGNCLSTDIYAYNDTLWTGLPMFFSSYDMDFEAHETPAAIDYPLADDKMNLTGIDYIYTYLQKLQLENEFSSYFPVEAIHCLLRGYDRQYKELLFNVFELVLTNAIGCLLIDQTENGKDGSGGGNENKSVSVIGLHISDYGRQYLQRSLSPLPDDKLDGLVDEALSRLAGILSISDPRLVDYLRASAFNLKSRLKNALETDGLKQLFLSAEEETAEPAIRFEDKKVMDDDSFRRLADEIRECRFISDKLSLLRGILLSLTDLIGLLEADCFFGEEYQDVFASLENIQLALLVKKLPLDPDSSFLKNEPNREWQHGLNLFLTQMDPERKSAVLSLAERLEINPDIM